jgi:hypothetical protein
VMEEVLEPGLAWMVMATEEGGMERIQEGKSLGCAEGEDFADSAGLAFAFSFLPFDGAIFLSLLPHFSEQFEFCFVDCSPLCFVPMISEAQAQVNWFQFWWFWQVHLFFKSFCKNKITKKK